MPEVEYTTTMSLSPEAIWQFVKDMNNWAPFLTGYQKHVIETDTDSIWTLKGDVGVLQKVVNLRAHVTDWNGPQRVAFNLTGLDEQVEGGGELTIAPITSSPVVGSVAPPPRRNVFARFIDWIFRTLFRRMHGNAPQRITGRTAQSQLTFKLRMTAGGPMAPMVNAFLAPALLPAAEDLANKIAAHLERQVAA